VSVFQILSFVFASLSVAVLHLGLIAAFIILRTKDVESPEFIEKFQPLVEGQEVYKKAGKYWTVIYLLR